MTSDIIQKIHTYLSINEIFRKCAVNVKFNLICQRESLWKSAVNINYGVEICGIEDFTVGNNFDLVRGCDDNWKATAKRLFEMKMCNLGKKWVDGRTYREIAETAIKEGKGCMKYLEVMRNKITNKITGNVGPLYFPFYLEEYEKEIYIFVLETLPLRQPDRGMYIE